MAPMSPIRPISDATRHPSQALRILAVLGGALWAGLCAPPVGRGPLAQPSLAPRLAAAYASHRPPADRDGDGVPDEIDRCPERPGPLANLGCPDRDEDNDGIIDRLDYCPSVPGSPADNGCPGSNTTNTPANQAAQSGQPGQSGSPGAGLPVATMGMGAQQGQPGDASLVQISDDRFRFAEPISFEPGRETLTARGTTEVAATARLLVSRPDLRLLLIEGHVDEPGNTAARAKRLSEQRAETVKQTLVQLGVPAERLRTAGFGYTRLLDRSETPAAQKKNNRIEMIVLRQ